MRKAIFALIVLLSWSAFFLAGYQLGQKNGFRDGALAMARTLICTP
jgi:hypothetical protein